MAQEALHKGQEQHIDPGHIILNYAKTYSQWAAANKTLDKLADGMDALTIIRQKLKEHLSIDMLPEDSLNFIYDITEIKTHKE